MKRFFDKNDYILHSLPALILLIYFFVSFFLLRNMQQLNLFPFSQWSMFSISRNFKILYFLEFRDSDNKIICNSIACPSVFPKEIGHSIFQKTQILGAYNNDESTRAKIFILQKIHYPFPLKITIKEIISRKAAFLSPDLSNGRLVKEFSYEPK